MHNTESESTGTAYSLAAIHKDNQTATISISVCNSASLHCLLLIDNYRDHLPISGKQNQYGKTANRGMQSDGVISVTKHLIG